MRLEHFPIPENSKITKFLLFILLRARIGKFIDTHHTLSLPRAMVLKKCAKRI